MRHQNLSDLLANGGDGVECGERLLEDHGDTAASNLAHVRLWLTEQLLAAEEDGAGDNGLILDEEADRGERRDALPRARLANHGETLALADGEGDVLHHLDHARGGLEGDVEVLHLNHRCPLCAAHLRPRGSSAERRVSPIMLIESEVRTMKRPGNPIHHQFPCCKNFADSERMFPQVGVAGFTPKPR